MDDFPIWMKAIIYIIMAGTIIYAISAAVYYSF
jgi:hypothetical protein